VTGFVFCVDVAPGLKQIFDFAQVLCRYGEAMAIDGYVERSM
jgi:hypothetical protein